MAFEFDGTSRLQAVGVFAILGSISCAAWIKTNSTTTAVKSVISCYHWDPFNHNFAIYGSAVRFEFNNAGRRAYQSSYAVLTIGQWHHIAVTYADGGTPVIYVDGVPVSGSWTETTGTNALVSGAQPLCIGGSLLGGYYFNGQILEAAEWSRELTADEIGQLSASGIITRTPLTIHPDDLECYYPLDDASEGATVTIARDASGSGRDMTAQDTDMLGRAAPVMTLGAGVMLVDAEAEAEPEEIEAICSATVRDRFAHTGSVRDRFSHTGSVRDRFSHTGSVVYCE